MDSAHERELADNYSFFQSTVGNLLADHCGEYVLLRHREIVKIYARAIDAISDGYKTFEDGMFSVQKVMDRPYDLGFLSNGASDRDTF